MALATLIPVESILSVADAVRAARAIPADYLVGITDRNQAIEASIRNVHELRFGPGLRERRLTPQEWSQLKRREAASRAVTCHENRHELAANELLGLIYDVGQHLRRPEPGDPEPECLELMLHGYELVLAELGQAPN